MNLLSEEISFAQRFSDDFKKVFSVNGALKSHFVLANRDLFLSRYYALIRGVCHINGRPAPDLQMLPANVSFHFIFFTWIRIEYGEELIRIENGEDFYIAMNGRKNHFYLFMSRGKQTFFFGKLYFSGFRPSFAWTRECVHERQWYRHPIQFH